MSIPARFPGICPECGERWQPGDLIRTAGLTTEPGQWRHDRCPNVLDLDGIRPGETLCPDCWLIHPEGECDR